MQIDAAKTQIAAALGRMNAVYRKPVFDEWMVVALEDGRGVLLAYSGLRGEAVRGRFAEDCGPLRAELDGRCMEVGDFEFTLAGEGTQFDACLKVGGGSYLICNNTARSMAEIRRNPLWLQAQKTFVDLSDSFRADPLG